jgi:peptide/nickel transport system substrate-binding protein
MLKRRDFALLAAASPLAFGGRLAHAATPKDTFVVAKDISDILTLDPQELYEITGGEVGIAIYDQLLRYDPEDVTKIIGGAAQTWSATEDGKEYTFKIRPGMKFESGATVTADDIAWSMQRGVLLDKTPAFLLNQFGWSKDNVKDVITAPDAGTLHCKLINGFAPSLVYNVMTTIITSPVEKKVAMAHETNGDMGNAWLKTNSAGSGAFRLVSWKANESVTMEANPHYHLGAPLIKRVVLRHVPEPESQRLLLEKGDADIAINLTADQLKPLESSKSVKIESFPAAETWYMAMNMSDERFKNPKVRQAMKMLVDYDGIANTFLKGRVTVHQTFWPMGLYAAIKYNPFKLDVAKAKSLLAEAGYPNGFEVNVGVPSQPPNPDIAQAVQQTMAQAGVKLNLQTADLKQVLGGYRTRKHQLVVINWSPDYFDPHSNADSFAHNDDDSDTAKTHPLAWRNHYYDPDVNKMMAAAAQELNSEKRKAAYAALMKKVTDEGPFIIMFQNAFQEAFRTNVKGYYASVDYDNYRKVTKS